MRPALAAEASQVRRQVNASSMAKLGAVPYGIRPAGWTYDELSHASDIREKTVREWIAAMRKEGAVRAAGFAVNSRGVDNIKCFALANGLPDAKRVRTEKNLRRAALRAARKPREINPPARRMDTKIDLALATLNRAWSGSMQAGAQ